MHMKFGSTLFIIIFKMPHAKFHSIKFVIIRWRIEWCSGQLEPNVYVVGDVVPKCRQKRDWTHCYWNKLSWNIKFQSRHLVTTLSIHTRTRIYSNVIIKIIFYRSIDDNSKSNYILFSDMVVIINQSVGYQAENIFRIIEIRIKYVK